MVRVRHDKMAASGGREMMLENVECPAEVARAIELALPGTAHPLPSPRPR